MSGTSSPTDYDLGYADGRRDSVDPTPDQFENHMQSATGHDRYEDGYVEGYLDRQDDELQIEFALIPRIRALLLAGVGKSIGPFRRAQ